MNILATIETEKISTVVQSFSHEGSTLYRADFVFKESSKKGGLVFKIPYEEYKKTGGTLMFCPSCMALKICEALDPTHLGESKDQRLYQEEHSDIHWFRRARRCHTCFYTFLTAEVDEAFLNELIHLRDDVASGKPINIEDPSKYGNNIFPIRRNG
ncbi:MAG: hypothetical protein ACOY4U_11145 [Pseudomonadota bacterium]